MAWIQVKQNQGEAEVFCALQLDVTRSSIGRKFSRDTKEFMFILRRSSQDDPMV
jgi:hypothetical protein